MSSDNPRPETQSEPAGPPQERLQGSEDQKAYLEARKYLKDLLRRKEKVETDLENTQDEIYREEGAYLIEASAGNVARGFEYYTKSSQNRRRSTLVEGDRIFSQSARSGLDDLA